MGAEVDRNRAERGQLAEQIFAVGRVEIIGFIGAEEVPDGVVWASRLAGVDPNGNRGGWGRQCSINERGRAWKKCKQKRDADCVWRVHPALQDTTRPAARDGTWKALEDIGSFEKLNKIKAHSNSGNHSICGSVS